jgi:Domain of unknown function (DUF4360)
MRRLLALLVATALSSTPGYAQDLRLGEAAYGGNGCPQGTARVVVGPQATTLSILFDQYQAVAGGNAGRSFDRKTCNLAIPLHVPSGYSVSVLAIDYRGFNYLPRTATSTFRVEYFFAGATGPVFSRSFSGPRSDDFLISNDLAVGARVWSACGEDVILRANSSIFVSTSQGQAIATVDTEDIAAALVYHLQWRRC